MGSRLLSAVPASAAPPGPPAPRCSSPAETQQPGCADGGSLKGRSATCSAGWTDEWSQSATEASGGSWVWWWLTGQSLPSGWTDSWWLSWSHCSAGWCLYIQGPYWGYTAPLWIGQVINNDIVTVLDWENRKTEFVGVELTHSKLHKVLVLFSQHVQEQVGYLQLLQILHVLWVVCKIGQISQHLLLCLWWNEKSRFKNNNCGELMILAYKRHSGKVTREQNRNIRYVWHHFYPPEAAAKFILQHDDMSGTEVSESKYEI